MKIKNRRKRGKDGMAVESKRPSDSPGVGLLEKTKKDPNPES